MKTYVLYSRDGVCPVRCNGQKHYSTANVKPYGSSWVVKVRGDEVVDVEVDIANWEVDDRMIEKTRKIVDRISPYSY